MRAHNIPSVFTSGNVQVAEGPLDSDRLYPIVPSIFLDGNSEGTLDIPFGTSDASLNFWGLLIDSSDLGIHLLGPTELNVR